MFKRTAFPPRPRFSRISSTPPAAHARNKSTEKSTEKSTQKKEHEKLDVPVSEK